MDQIGELLPRFSLCPGQSVPCGYRRVKCEPIGLQLSRAFSAGNFRDAGAGESRGSYFADSVASILRHCFWPLVSRLPGCADK